MSRQPTSRSCFVCGRENPVGLKVRWDQDPEAGEIRGTVTVPGHFNGYPGVTLAGRRGLTRHPAEKDGVTPSTLGRVGVRGVSRGAGERRIPRRPARRSSSE